MSQLKTNSSHPRSVEKLPNKSSYLENAIQNLSSLLGQNIVESPITEATNTNESPIKSLELKDEDVDHYISVLTDRLIKIQEGLTNEESLLFKEQEENIELKAKWSEEVKKQENTVKLGKSEIIKLSDQNKEIVNEMHSILKEKELLLKEIDKVDTEIEKVKKDSEKYRVLHDAYSQKNEQQLNAELRELKNLIEKETDFREGKERKIEHVKKEIAKIQTIIENLDKKALQIKEKTGKLQREKNCGEDKNQKFLSDYKASIAKKNKLDKKLEELTLITKKFEEEIVLKNQQMELGRKKNQTLEIKKIKFDTLSSHISLEKEIKSTFLMEKEMLQKHLEALACDDKNNHIAKEMNNNTQTDNILEKKKSVPSLDANSFIEELKKSQKNLNHIYDKFIDLPLEKFEDYYQILEENIKLEDKVQDLEIKIAEKNAAIDDLDKENNFIKYENKRTFQKMDEIKFQKTKLLEKYNILEKEMKNLGIKEKIEKSSKDGFSGSNHKLN